MNAEVNILLPPSSIEAPEISIVISTFDRPAALSRCLGAMLLQQLSQHFEIIVVDNHPQSGLTQAGRSSFPMLCWLQEPITGLSRARNAGISIARGRVIVTADDDIVPPADWLTRLTSPFFAGMEDVGATTGNCIPLKIETEAEALFEAYGGLQHGPDERCFDARWMAKWRVCSPHLWRIGTTANAAYLTSVLRDPNVGPFESSLGAGTSAGAWEDLYGFYRILRAGYRICYLPDACVAHAHREDMGSLLRQLCAYRRGETAFLWLILTRHKDYRALGQLLFWIPQWRLRLMLGEVFRRLIGRRRYSLRFLWLETMAYFNFPDEARPSH